MDTVIIRVLTTALNQHDESGLGLIADTRRNIAPQPAALGSWSEYKSGNGLYSHGDAELNRRRIGVRPAPHLTRPTGHFTVRQILLIPAGASSTERRVCAFCVERGCPPNWEAPVRHEDLPVRYFAEDFSTNAARSRLALIGKNHRVDPEHSFRQWSNPLQALRDDSDRPV